MADIISSENIMLFQDAFNDMADAKGIVPTKMLGRLLKNVGENPTEAEIQDMVNEVDSDATGFMKFPQFLFLMAKKIDNLVAEDEIREAFKVFDCDGNGFISRSELRHVMMNLGEKMDEEECQYLVDQADIDGDGSINYEEFCLMMNSAGTYVKGEDCWQ